VHAAERERHEKGHFLYCILTHFEFLSALQNVQPPDPSHLVFTALKRANDFITSLMSNQPKSLPLECLDKATAFMRIQGVTQMDPGLTDMRVLEDVMDLRNGSMLDIVIRPITQPFFQHCIDSSTRHRVCAAGNPGIGKSITFFYLMKLILESRACTVVYKNRGDDDTTGFYYEFTSSLVSQSGEPDKFEVTAVDVHSGTLDAGQIKSLGFRTNFYLVDPGRSIDSCNPSNVVVASVIIVPSLDSRHWGSSDFFKDHSPPKKMLKRESNSRGEESKAAGIMLYNSIWTLQQLLMAQPYMFQMMTLTQIHQATHVVGFIPRQILKFTDCQMWTQAQNNQRNAISKLNPDQARHIVLGNIGELDSHQTTMPSSDILCYTSQSPFDTPCVSVASPMITERIARRFGSDLWGLIQSGSHQGSCADLFEHLVRHLLKERKLYQCSLAGPVKDRAIEDRTLGGCAGTRNVVDICRSVKHNAEGTLFHSSNPRYPAIDAIWKEGSTYYAVNMTVGITHSADLTSVVASLDLQAGEELQMHYAVCLENMFKFTTQPVNPDPQLRCTIWIMGVPKPSNESEI
jgi:hypothetical protein